MQADEGQAGDPKDDCEKTCGQLQDSTPTELIGYYRGLMVSDGCVEGEWKATFTEDSVVIMAPDGTPWAKGSVSATADQLWITSEGSTRKGLRSWITLPEVGVLSWALGEEGGNAPSTFGDGMESGTTFVLERCLNPSVCSFSVARLAATLANVQSESHRVRERTTRAVQQEVQDPCGAYPDCHSCISASEQCGFCSVPILYNSTIEGNNCASVNKTIAGNTINCTGIFSVVDCTAIDPPSSESPSTESPSGDTGDKDKYVCDPQAQQCVEADEDQPGGMDQDTCEAQCNVIPGVPQTLKNKLYHGIAIHMGYAEGMYVLQFDADSATVTAPDGTTSSGKISMIGQFLTWESEAGTYQILWQTAQGPATEFLTWALSAPDGEVPQSYDESMVTDGMGQFSWVGCLTGDDCTCFEQ
jgi:hypothetical protein